MPRSTRFLQVLCALAASLLVASSTATAGFPAPLFTGTNSYILAGVPDALQIPSGSPFTIEGWTKLDAVDTRDILYSKNSARGTPYSYLLGLIDGGNLAAYTGSAWVQPSPAATASTGQWHHLAFSFDGAVMAYYLDGSLKGTSAFSYVNTAAHTVKLGGYTTTADIQGSKSDVRVWNRARSGHDIDRLRFRRLHGREPGLIGYWPLNEGTGTVAQDVSGNGSTGTIVNAAWVTVEDLPLQPAPADFAYAPFFTLASLETGSERFTNSNAVELAAFPIPEGYDRFQITESGDAATLGDWSSTSAIPDRIAYTPPVADSTITLYAWFTNSVVSVPLLRSEGAITYTTAAPIPAIRTAFTRELVPGYHVAVQPGEADAGSTGGEALGQAMAIHHLALTLTAGPDTNATPEEPTLTISTLGDYTLTLTVVNEAGNTATSTGRCTLSVIPSTGVFSWNGLGGNGDWFTPGNWMPVGLPEAGGSVRIDNAGSVLLTNGTPILGSLWISNATVTVSNWATAIRADSVTIGQGGVLTLPAAFIAPGMSNRIHVQCGAFDLLPGGLIDATGKGYAGGYGPSQAGTGSRLSGAGYGGRGGANPHWGDSRYGVAYGSVSGPLEPGSGGCGTGYGGAGGGLVQVEATGTASIQGTIQADGMVGLPLRYNGPGGGSGGGVFLSCHTFTGGGSGSISVRGGEGVKEKISAPAGRGGGGRVVILYEEASPWPGVSIDADVGASGSVTEPFGESHSAQWGTLHVSDGSLLAGLTNNPGESFAVRHVTLYMEGVTHWAPASLAVSNVAFRFGDTNMLLAVAGPLEVGPGGRLGAYRMQADSVRLHGGGVLEVRAGSTDETRAWGGGLDVANGLTVGSNSMLAVYADPDTGGAPRIRVGSLVVESNGWIDASAKGFPCAAGPGAGSSEIKRSGGGYGGHGGTGLYAEPGGLTYGEALGPLLAGSGGCYAGRGGDGGGLVHIESAGGVSLHGGIRADGGHGMDGQYESAGGGSGGGIFLACSRIESGSGGRLSARGGNGRTSGGGGGGGRIALWTGLSPELFQGYWQRVVEGRAIPAALVETNALPRGFADAFTNTVDLAGGGPVAVAGESGTFRWLTVRLGSLIMVK